LRAQERKCVKLKKFLQFFPFVEKLQPFTSCYLLHILLRCGEFLDALVIVVEKDTSGAFYTIDLFHITL